MKLNKTVNRIERALWEANRSCEPFAGGPGWQDEVMAAIRRLGPLAAPSPARFNERAAMWSWATALAACLAIFIGWYAFNDLNSDAVLAGLLADDPTSLTVNMMLVEM